MAKIKRTLTRMEEFEILKLILDKFLWLGVGIMAYGFYRAITVSQDVMYNIAVMLGGAILLLIFMTILVREYHFAKN